MFARFSYQKYTSEPERNALESQLVATNDSPSSGLAFNWTRTLGPTQAERGSGGVLACEVSDNSTVDWAGIGNANATIGIPGEQAIAGLSEFNIPANYGLGDRGGSRSSTTSRHISSRTGSPGSGAATR